MSHTETLWTMWRQTKPNQSKDNLHGDAVCVIAWRQHKLCASGMQSAFHYFNIPHTLTRFITSKCSNTMNSRADYPLKFGIFYQQATGRLHIIFLSCECIAHTVLHTAIPFYITHPLCTRFFSSFMGLSKTSLLNGMDVWSH